MDDLGQLRGQAQDAIALKQFDALLGMADTLRHDTELWATWFAPECAFAARATGRDDARAFLDEAISGGFAQYELFPHLVAAFSVDADWDFLVSLMNANVPKPPLEILEWPAPHPTLPLDLDQLPPDRSRLTLKAQLPPAAATAWETATATLAWVATRWPLGGDASPTRDAIDILERADAGGQFGCVEYTVVLSQALNLLGIPARSVGLMTGDYHFGYGRGHNVTEAWIDDLGRWVLLDGQNGLYWVDAYDSPLGLVELQAMHAAGRGPARPVATSRPLADGDAAFWWRTFAHGTVGGRSTATWRADGPYVPAFQGEHVATCTYLLHDPADAYPDLSNIAVGVSAIGGGTQLLLHTAHPYAIGFSVMCSGYASVTVPIDVPRWRFTGNAGENTAVITTITPYGTLKASQVRYLVRD